MPNFATAIQHVKNRIDFLEGQLNPNISVLEACPFVVVSPCRMYSVGVKNGNGICEIDKIMPNQFSKKEADRIAKGFNCTNGRGKIVWEVIPVKQFHIEKLAELKTVYETIINFDKE